MLRTPAILPSFAFRGAPSPLHAHEGRVPIPLLYTDDSPRIASCFALPRSSLHSHSAGPLPRFMLMKGRIPTVQIRNHASMIPDLSACSAGESLPHAEFFKYAVDDVVGNGLSENLGKRRIGIREVRSQKFFRKLCIESLLHPFERAERIP